MWGLGPPQVRAKQQDRLLRMLADNADDVRTRSLAKSVLDNVQQSAALDSARSEAMKDKVNAERYEYLYSQGAVSAKDRDTYVTEAIQSRDEARADAANLGYKFVRAPIDGVIGDLDEVGGDGACGGEGEQGRGQARGQEAQEGAGGGDGARGAAGDARGGARGGTG